LVLIIRVTIYTIRDTYKHNKKYSTMKVFVQRVCWFFALDHWSLPNQRKQKIRYFPGTGCR